MLCYYMCDDLKDMNDIVRIDMNTEFVLPHNVRSHRFVVLCPNSLFLCLFLWNYFILERVTLESKVRQQYNFRLQNVLIDCRQSAACTRTYMQKLVSYLMMDNFISWRIKKIRDQSFTINRNIDSSDMVWRLEFGVYIFCREEQEHNEQKRKKKEGQVEKKCT